MILSQDDLKSVINGKTTETRLPVRKRRKSTAIMPCPVRAGRSYQLQVRVDATEEEAAHVKPTAHYVRVLGVQREEQEWVVTFQRGKFGPVRLLSATKRAMDNDPEPQDELRRLELQEGDDARGYTSRESKALLDAGECVDDAVLQRFAVDNWMAHEKIRKAHGAQLDSLPLERRLERAKANAHARGVDVSSDVRVIERRIAAMERKASDRAA